MALIGAGIPEHEAKYYQGEFEAGRAIVTVNAGEQGRRGGPHPPAVRGP